MLPLHQQCSIIQGGRNRAVMYCSRSESRQPHDFHQLKLTAAFARADTPGIICVLRYEDAEA
jgi:hypothetical protein